MSWFIYALMGTVSFSVMLLLFKYFGQRGLKAHTILFYVFGIGTVFYLGNSLIVQIPLEVNLHFLLILIAAAFFSYLGDLFIVKSLIIAPNPGYAEAVAMLRILIIAIAAVFLFGSEFSLVKIAGALLMITGVFLFGMTPPSRRKGVA